MKRCALIAVVALAALGLVACAGAPAIRGEPPRQQPSLAEQQQAVNPASVDGYTLSIPTIGVRSGLVSLGLNPDGTVQTPPLNAPEQVGLYREGPRPGEVGPAVLLSHINGGGRPGGFARLAEMREGDTIDVDTPTGAVSFTVYRVSTVEKGSYPTAAVYGDVPGPELRLVSCGGAYDPVARSYEANVIVWARKV